MSSDKKREKKPFLKRRWVQVGIAVIVLTPLLYTLGIFGAKYYLINWFEKNGADSATIDKLWLNPFTARLDIKGLDVQSGGKSLIKHSDLAVDVGLGAIFSKNIKIQDAIYKDVILDIEQYDDGSFRIGSYTIPAGSSEEAPATETTDSVASAWAFLADFVHLANCKVKLKTPEIDFELQVDEAKLNKFTTREGKQGATLTFAGALNGEPLSIDLKKLYISPALELEGNVDVSRFQLAELAKLLESTLPTFSGDVGLSGDVIFKMGEEGSGTIAVDYNGTIDLQNPDIGSDSFATKAATLNWQGDVAYVSGNKQPMTIVTDGTLSAGVYELGVPGAAFTTNESRIELTGKNSVTIAENIVVKNNGALNIENFAMSLPGTDIKEDSFSWKGEVHYDSDHSGSGQYVAADGALGLGPFDLVTGSTESLVKIASKDFSYNGKVIYEQPNNIIVKSKGELAVDQFAMSLPGTDIKEDSLSWKGDVSYDSDHSGSGQYVAAEGTLGLGPLGVATGSEKSPVTVASTDFSWDGNIVYGQQEGGVNSYLNLAGVLGGKEIQTEMAGAGSALQQGLVSLTTESEVVFGEKFDIKGTNTLHLDEFSFEGGEGVPKVQLAKLTVEDLQGLGGSQLRLKDLVSEGLAVNVYGSMPLDIDVPKISLGQFATDDLANFSLGNITLHTPRIVAVKNGKEFLRLKDITASDLQVDEAINVTVGDVNLAELTLLDGSKDGAEKAFLTLGGAKLAAISWGAERGLAGETLHFDKLVTNIIRDKDGAINISKSLADMQLETDDQAGDKEKVEADAETATNKSEAVAQQTEESGGTKIRLGQVAIQDNSKVHFEDHTLAVPYITDLTIDKMELKNLDSTKPEVKSPLILRATLEERAPITVDAHVSPFLSPIAVDMDMKLKNYPLKRLSAYTVQAVGTALASGQLGLTTTMDLANDRLDMENEVVLKKLETEMISKELADELDNQLPIPLDTALSILRDSSKNITLDIPIKGPVSDLSVGISDVLITALSKAIVPAASGYLMYALGPYGALAYVGMKAGEKMLKLELPPVVFEPGKEEIADEQKKYLEKVAEIMAGRPDTDIQVCPVVGSWELMDAKALAAKEASSVEVVEEERQSLADLGQQRAKNVQGFLVSSYGVDVSRLLICDTKIDTSKKVQPAVLLNL